MRFGAGSRRRRVSLQSVPREVVGLIGTNGAGKSTLMNESAASSRRGRVELLGRDVTPHRLPPGRPASVVVPGRAPLRRPHRARDGLVALEARDRTLVPRCRAPPSAARTAKRAEADDIDAIVGSSASPTLSSTLHRHAADHRARGPGRAGARGSCCSTSRPPASRKGRPRRSGRSSAESRRARRRGTAHRARHAARDVGQRPGLLPRSRHVIAEGTPEEVRHDPPSSRATSAPTCAAIQRSGLTS